MQPNKSVTTASQHVSFCQNVCACTHLQAHMQIARVSTVEGRKMRSIYVDVDFNSMLLQESLQPYIHVHVA
jgi:hypothetical protein